MICSFTALWITPYIECTLVLYYLYCEGNDIIASKKDEEVPAPVISDAAKAAQPETGAPVEQAAVPEEKTAVAEPKQDTVPVEVPAEQVTEPEPASYEAPAEPEAGQATELRFAQDTETWSDNISASTREE